MLLNTAISWKRSLCDGIAVTAGLDSVQDRRWFLQSRDRQAAGGGDYNRWFCALVNGETETRHGYASAGGRRYVEVDCETGTMVYEGGLDKRSSLDSVQQALFFSHVTGKRRRRW